MKMIIWKAVCWFDQKFPIGTEIVTTGAQLLLSEEFKYIIQNENDD